MNEGGLSKSPIKRLSDAFIHYTQFSQNTYIIILSIIVGILGGFAAIGFRMLIAFFQKLAIGSSGDVLEALSQLPWYIKLIVPVCGAMVVGPMICFFAREAKGHGVP